MTRSLLAAALLSGALASWALTSAVYTIEEGHQALIVRMGMPLRVDAQPGLKVKAPLIDTVIPFDTRLLLLELPAEQIILGDQKRLETETYARFRIADPLRFYQSLHSVEQARAQLSQFVSSSVRRELGQTKLPSLLSADRAGIVSSIEREVAEKAQPLGINVVEVRFHSADLPSETRQAVYDRMKSERQREAKELRAQGSEWAQEIQARADRDRTVILSEAERDSKIIRGDGDARANQLVAEAFGQDPRFYDFYRSLQTYRLAVAQAGPTLVLSPDAEFLKVFQRGPEARENPRQAADDRANFASDR
jgi:modulator of FtsH protease HflC